jgi:3-dehydroquinate synthase
MIVLIGFMGAGKTTVGRILSEKTGLPFIDTDAVVESEAGKKVDEIFKEGEARFRALERDAVARTLAGPEAIVAVGGGATGDPVTCAALEWHTVVYLDVPYEKSMRRIGHDPGRPMLTLADPLALYEKRRATYSRIATHVVDAEVSDASGVAEAIMRATGTEILKGPARVEVSLAERSYPVVVGSDLLHDVGRLVPLPAGARGFVVTHPELEAMAKPLVDSLVLSGVESTTLLVDVGEASKTLATAEALLEELSAHGASRSDLLITFGGGVLSDLGGFVASAYHRGMAVLHVPTTLLAQVDAAVGGKTGVNLSHGKNLVGTIHQPIAVVCDVGLLRTLPEDELRSGLAEVIKYGLIRDPGLLSKVEASIDAILARDETVLASIVRRSVAIKASVVARDEREHGRREVLNYGHTFGHGIEHVTGSRHGEAIAVGMMAAAHLSVQLGMLDPDGIDVHRRALAAAGLPTSARFDVTSVVDTLKKDKKHRDKLRFVLLDGIGSVKTGIEASDQAIGEALGKVVL